MATRFPQAKHICFRCFSLFFQKELIAGTPRHFCKKVQGTFEDLKCVGSLSRHSWRLKLIPLNPSKKYLVCNYAKSQMISAQRSKSSHCLGDRPWNLAQVFYLPLPSRWRMLCLFFHRKFWISSEKTQIYKKQNQKYLAPETKTKSVNCSSTAG